MRKLHATAGLVKVKVYKVEVPVDLLKALSPQIIGLERPV